MTAAGRALPLASAIVLVSVLALTAACHSDAEKKAARWTGGDAARGKIAIRKFGCSSCHTIPGVPGADALVGPPLDRIAARAYVAGRLTNTPANMMRFIAHPHGTDRTTAMPEMGIPDRDVRDIAAYLYTLE
jgi:cytochrome c2